MSAAAGPHVTLHDVARLAEVSISTVSRALNGLPVSKKNLAKVQAAADHLGYVANEAARSLRSVRTLTFGVIFYELSTSSGLELLEALAASVDDEGYSLLVATARGDEERYELLMRRLLERRVDALFCVRPVGKGAVLDRYEKAGVPVVAMFSRDGGYRDLPLVAPTIVEASQRAVERLVELGHRRIGLITPSRRVDFMGAVRRTATKAGLEIQDFAPMRESLDVLSLLDSLKSEPNFPTAIIARAADAISIVNGCYEQNVKVPQDLSLIAIGDAGANSSIGPITLSTIHLNSGKVGRVAAADMFARLSGDDVVHEHFIENGSWIERGSTGPAAQRTPARTRAAR